MRRRVDEVFGMSNTLRRESYVDRGELDAELIKCLQRPVHVALRGESKCGKSWLRQSQLPGAITVQCRLGESVGALYIDALSQLDVQLSVEESSGGPLQGRVTAKGGAGAALLVEAGVLAAALGPGLRQTPAERSGRDIGDLRFVAEIIKSSGRRLVIEDFHYLPSEERTKFAYDLKALWEYGCYVVVIGVWSQSNLLLYLNQDLGGRVREIPIYWSDEDLGRVLDTGGAALNIRFSRRFRELAVHDCFGNVGALQKLVQLALDEIGIEHAPESLAAVEPLDRLDMASMFYAEQSSRLARRSARRVSSDLRT